MLHELSFDAPASGLDQETRPCFVRARVSDVADNPRLLVIDREASQGKSTLEKLGEAFDVVTVHSISKALSLFGARSFAESMSMYLSSRPCAGWA